MPALEIHVRYFNMFQLQWIKGLSVGLEYVETEEVGFIVNMDLGILRVTWYRDLIED